jgi:Mn-dependent DtxR family transcriptional regulator
MHGHQGHIERRNAEWNPRVAPSPRELEALRTWYRLAQTGARVRQLDVAAELGVGERTASHYFVALTRLGFMRIERGGGVKVMSLTESGRALVA